MTYDEVKTFVTDLVTNPDTAGEKSIQFLKDLETDYTTMTSLAEQHKTDEERIRTLQDTNQKLFLSVTGQPKDDPEEEKEPGIDWDNIIKEATTENGK